jgi:hypothetical protein
MHAHTRTSSRTHAHACTPTQTCRPRLARRCRSNQSALVPGSLTCCTVLLRCCTVFLRCCTVLLRCKAHAWSHESPQRPEGSREGSRVPRIAAGSTQPLSSACAAAGPACCCCGVAPHCDVLRDVANVPFPPQLSDCFDEMAAHAKPQNTRTR